jgi:hypothetical protein
MRPRGRPSLQTDCWHSRHPADFTPRRSRRCRRGHDRAQARLSAQMTTADSAVPPVSRTVARPTLWQHLDLSARVTVVSAPAGSGKTVLLASWIDQAKLADSSAFVQVMRDERDPQRLHGGGLPSAAQPASGRGHAHWDGPRRRHRGKPRLPPAGLGSEQRPTVSTPPGQSGSPPCRQSWHQRPAAHAQERVTCLSSQSSSST